MTQRHVSKNEETTFNYAEKLSKKATCPRRSVGCVIIRPNGQHVVGGYNGAPEGMETCMEEGCILEGGHCVRSVHAEIRAITEAVNHGIGLNGCIAFVTVLPCINCMQALLLCGVRTIYYDEEYDRPEKGYLHQLARSANVQLVERNRG